MRNTLRALSALVAVSCFSCGGGNPPPDGVATGDLVVDTNPAGASVFVDDAFKGETPLVVANVPVGDHELRIELEGFDTVTRDVTVHEGTNEVPMMDLVPTVSARGFLAVTTDPRELDGVPVVAQVIMNGSPTDAMTNGMTPGLVEVDTSVGHDVTVSFNGFLAVEQPDARCDPGSRVDVAVPIGADVNGRFRVESNGVIVEVGTSVARGRVEVRLGDADILVARGNDLFWGDDLSHAGSVAPDHRSFSLTYMGESETYTRL